MLIENIFVSTIAVDMLELDNEVIKNYCYSLKEKSNNTQYSNYGGWHSNQIKEYVPILSDLFGQITNRLSALHTHFLFKQSRKLNIDNFWVNINGKGHANMPHTHRGWTFSGVYYVQAHGKCGDLVLVHPSQQFPYHYEDQPFAEKSIKLSASHVHYKPEPGKLVIIPSWMQHYVEPNLTDTDRISIAFDVNLLQE
jgi:uncharacterized protein (TIGR02466 family)